MSHVGLVIVCLGQALKEFKQASSLNPVPLMPITTDSLTPVSVTFVSDSQWRARDTNLNGPTESETLWVH